MSKTGLTPVWTMQQINTKILTDTLKFEKSVIDSFAFMGEQIVNDARKSADFKDQTGNLRHSIGYKVFVDGKSNKENFEGSDEGTSIGKTLADQVAANEKGILLVVVAGMDYAGYVEAKGYNVLTKFVPEKSQIESDFKLFFAKW